MEESYTSESAKASGAQMSVEDIGKLNRKHKRQPEQFAQEIMAHIQTKGTFPPFPEVAKTHEIKPCDFSRFPGQTWGEPDLGLLGCSEITPEFMPEWFAKYARAIADNTQTPVTMATLLGLSALATVLQGKALVQGLSKSHKEELVIWTVTVLPPGNQKSPVFKAMTEPLRDWQVEEGKRGEQEREARNEQIDIAKRRIERLKKEAAETGDAEQALSEIAKLKEVLKTAIPKPLLYVSKGTMEGIRDILKQNGEKIGILSAEGGLFDLVCGLYNAGEADIDLLLHAFFGEYFNDNRAGGVMYELLRPLITLGLAVQPVILSSLASGGSGSKGKFRARGGAGRFIYGVPTSLVGQRSVEKEPTEVPPEVEHDYKDRMMRLLRLLPEHANTVEGTVYTPVLVLDPQARALYKRWWSSLERRHGTDSSGKSDDRDLAAIQDWTTKSQGTILRIAGLIHFAKHVENATKVEIDGDTMSAAIRFYDQAVPHAQAAYFLMGDSKAPTNKRAHELYEWLVSERREYFLESLVREPEKGTTKAPSVFASKNMPAEQWHQILKVLERANVVSGPIRIETGGRPALARRINPAIYA
ncbi:MAG: DUF3987 domain-containing protein [Candidatus Obscuribacter sp.]|nr:DUF3987 domain-containing protein [Candidatus Obscuribacter sp.]MBK9278766.1 DUF3987 domain-containing protein [Candidatus Obscuribacter sp.]